MQVILLTDIDDSLMQTARKCAGLQGFQVGAVNKEAEPSSFLTPKQQKLWRFFQERADLVVPVTARSQSALARVQLPFAASAVCDFGATVITSSGAVDTAWHERIAHASSQQRQAEHFEALTATIARGHALLKTEYRFVRGVGIFVNFRADAGQAQIALRIDIERVLRLWEI